MPKMMGIRISIEIYAGIDKMMTFYLALAGIVVVK